MAEKNDDPSHFIAVAKKHLVRVKGAWNPPDWSDLGTYGTYCLEALIRAAALKAGETPIRTHWGKADQATNLANRHGLPDIAPLHQKLNALRKAEGYGDTEIKKSDYDAKAIVQEIENYFSKVSEFCAK